MKRKKNKMKIIIKHTIEKDYVLELWIEKRATFLIPTIMIGKNSFMKCVDIRILNITIRLSITRDNLPF